MAITMLRTVRLRFCRRLRLWMLSLSFNEILFHVLILNCCFENGSIGTRTTNTQRANVCYANANTIHYPIHLLRGGGGGGGGVNNNNNNNSNNNGSINAGGDGTDDDATTSATAACKKYTISVYSTQGKRQYMEDEYFTNQDGSFAAIFDGHGGKAVSRYLRQNLYARYLQAKARNVNVVTLGQKEQHEINQQGDDDDKNGDGEENDESQIISDTKITVNDTKNILNTKLLSTNSNMKINHPHPPSKNKNNVVQIIESCVQALTSAFHKIDTEVNRISHWSFQGSTAVAVLLCHIPDTKLTQIEEEQQPITSSLGSMGGKKSRDENKNKYEDENENDETEFKMTNTEINNIEIKLQTNKNKNTNTNNTKNQKQHKTILISANVGDSRAVLSHSGKAVDLTTDHKPNNPSERERIEALGGKIKWYGPVHPHTGQPIHHTTSRTRNNKQGRVNTNNNHMTSSSSGSGRSKPTTTSRRTGNNRSGNIATGVYRINGNLALSRAIGDRSERPLVCAQVDIQQIELDSQKDEFVIVASDGLWVSYILLRNVILAIFVHKYWCF